MSIVSICEANRGGHLHIGYASDEHFSIATMCVCVCVCGCAMHTCAFIGVCTSACIYGCISVCVCVCMCEDMC